MRKIKLTVTYEGARFHGWQRQPGRRSVQGELEKAVEGVTGRPGPVVGAGRTDAGVHAKAQAAHFSTTTSIGADRLVHALNAHLPRDLAVLQAEDVDKEFHARINARGKVYRYRLYVGAVRPVRERAFVHHVRSKLNLTRMRKAARLLVGRHNFKGFADAQAAVRHHVRTISLVGTLVEVGRGKFNGDRIKEILRTGRRDLAGPTLPAKGLTLVKVEY